MNTSTCFYIIQSARYRVLCMSTIANVLNKVLGYQTIYISHMLWRKQRISTASQILTCRIRSILFTVIQLVSYQIKKELCYRCHFGVFLILVRHFATLKVKLCRLICYYYIFLYIYHISLYAIQWMINYLLVFQWTWFKYSRFRR